MTGEGLSAALNVPIHRRRSQCLAVLDTVLNFVASADSGR